MFVASAMVGTGRGTRSGDVLAARRWDAADAGADAARTPFSGEAEPDAARPAGDDGALAALSWHDEPDAADLADADDAVGVLDRWMWFEDPRTDDWWVGDALEDATADLGRDARAAVDRAGADARTSAGGADEDARSAADRGAADEGEAPSGLWPWASAEFLERALPGSGLARLLELAGPERLDDAALVESVAAWERLAAWAHLGAALAAGELSRRASMNPLWREPVPSRTCVAGDELAMRLGWSRPAAARLVRDGRALDNELLPVADAVRDGLLDTAKLRVLTDRLADRAYQLSWPVLEQVLPDAATRTPTQLAADVDRALLAADPADAAIRLPKALATRHVCHPRRLPDGMAGLWAVLPATDAARIDGTLEATARAARAAGDPRTLDQLRADTLTDLATGTALLAGVALAGGTGGTRHDGATRTDARFGASLAAAPNGDGQEPDDTLRLPDQVDQETDGVGQVLDDRQCEPDLVPEASPGTDRSRPPGRAAPGIRIPKVRIDVTVALSTLMGLDELPGELAGLGPIPAEQARALAAGGTWRRIVTDPLTGTVLDVGRTRYRPPAGLAEHVLARDGACAGPGCSVPGHRCDLDHTTEYHGTPANGSPQRGTTSADNLGPLSSRCHRLKTDGGFTLKQIQPGVFEWHTPAGLTYRVTPGRNGRTERLDKHAYSGYPEVPPF